ncbi:MAG: diaminopimelate epimerase [Campylobacterota bacterium]
MFVAKYNASGNDFVITHAFASADRSDLAVAICDRHSGVGADGFVVLLPGDTHDFIWEFYNSDGSVAQMCGNATRAVAHYAYSHNLAGENCTFLTGAGQISAHVSGDFVISDLTRPRIMKENIAAYGAAWDLIDTGVPHLVSFREDISDFDLQAARKLREEYNANVNIYLLQGSTMHVRTYERGVEDETQACGTGMAACFVHAKTKGLDQDRIKAYPLSGEELLLEQKDQTLRFGGRVANSFNTTWQ